MSPLKKPRGVFGNHSLGRFLCPLHASLHYEFLVGPRKGMLSGAQNLQVTDFDPLKQTQSLQLCNDEL